MQNRLEIPQTWTNLNLLSGHAVGESLTIQNISHAGDVFSLYISPIEPNSDYLGVALDQIKRTATINKPAGIVWVKYYRPDGAIPYAAKVGLMQIDLKGQGIILGHGDADDSSQIQQLKSIERAVCVNTEQLKLLNARIEENFETGIDLRDVT